MAYLKHVDVRHFLDALSLSLSLAHSSIPQNTRSLSLSHFLSESLFLSGSLSFSRSLKYPAKCEISLSLTFSHNSLFFSRDHSLSFSRSLKYPAKYEIPLSLSHSLSLSVSFLSGTLSFSLPFSRSLNYRSQAPVAYIPLSNTNQCIDTFFGLSCVRSSPNHLSNSQFGIVVFQ